MCATSVSGLQWNQLFLGFLSFSPSRGLELGCAGNPIKPSRCSVPCRPGGKWREESGSLRHCVEQNIPPASTVQLQNVKNKTIRSQATLLNNTEHFWAGEQRNYFKSISYLPSFFPLLSLLPQILLPQIFPTLHQ